MMGLLFVRLVDKYQVHLPVLQRKKFMRSKLTLCNKLIYIKLHDHFC
jgi:hypothetical protein